MPQRVLILQIILGAVFMLSSCSAFKFAKIYASSDNENNGALYGDIFTKDSTSYRIGTLGENWKVVNSEYGDLFFVNSKKDSAITVNSTCDPNKIKYSLEVLSGSLLVGIKGKKPVDKEIININGEEALFAVYDAEFEGDQLRIATAVFKKTDCIYDFTYSNINNEFDIYLEEFIGFISGFKVLE